MRFDDFMSRWNWKPIRNCPGRFLLDDPTHRLSLAELIGEDIEVSEFSVDRARDIVLVARIRQGGIISYKKRDGTFIHTLNTVEGFERKLGELGIKLPIKGAR